MDLENLHELHQTAAHVAECLRQEMRQHQVDFVKNMHLLEQENERLKRQLSTAQNDIKGLQKKTHMMRKELTYESLIKDVKKLKYYTGFESAELIEGFYTFLEPHINQLQYWQMRPSSTLKERKFALSAKDQFLLTLVRLRLGLDGMDLLYRYAHTCEIVLLFDHCKLQIIRLENS